MFRPRPGFLVRLIRFFVILLFFSLATACDTWIEAARAPFLPTITPEPIVPTATAPGNAQDQEGATPAAQSSPSPPATHTPIHQRPSPPPLATISPTPRQTPTSPVNNEMETVEIDELTRFGVGIARPFDYLEAAVDAGLIVGAALDWNVRLRPPAVPLQFWQMIRIGEMGIRKVDWPELADAIAANPGAYWMVGNEPDVKWQDNVTPASYAHIYHDVYYFIKEHDPTAQVVIGGVAQPTPLRRAYLDIVLDTYEEAYGEPMPVDIWNVHAFILREEADSWGVDIPPGMDGEQGMLYEIEDHDNMEIFDQNLRDFRRWMAERGYGDKPLVVSEYGILMPSDYGFPEEDVITFMTATLDYFREARGGDGFAPDDGRLVQWWFWYSLFEDQLYPTGNLWDPDNGRLTPLGAAWSAYIAENTTATAQPPPP